MQKKSLLFALVLGGLMLFQASCTTYSYTSRSTSVRQRVIDSREATADIEINYQKKVTATSDFQKFPNQAKQQAVYQCILNSGIDVLIDPIFQVENRPVTGYRATVTGFAGYYKVGKNELDQMVEKNYKQEDIDKYLLLTDPSYYQFYYQKESHSGNVYNIKCGAAAPALAKPAMPNILSIASPKAKAVKPLGVEVDAYKKAKALRNAGIALTCTGFFCPAGIPMIIVGTKRMKELKQ